jgi:2-oxoglutarate ferredoxin oxidoreductase subunit beta
LKTKQAIKKGFQMQIEGKGFSIVEILSPCPTYWGKPPPAAMKFIETDMVKTFPLGVFKG